MKRLPIAILILCLFQSLFAQENMVREESFLQRQDRVRVLPENPEKKRAEQWADSLGLPVRQISADGTIREIRRLSPTGQPVYLRTMNLNAARTVSTNRVWQNGGAGLSLSGLGHVVGVWDAGSVRTTHQEFENRGRKMDPTADEAGHSTHVAGTVGAAGIDENARGMANKAFVESYDWNNDLQEMNLSASDGLLVSNHSYGFVIGFDWNFDENRWEWWGTTQYSDEEDYLFGFYHEEAQEYDRIAYNNPYYLIVKSAGNDRGEGPAPGGTHYVWQSGDWVESTQVRQKDGGVDGFECMGPVSGAKNILAVGAVRDLPGGYTSSDAVKLTSFSVFGPTDDGRIKPDLVANGEALYSTYVDSDTAYQSSSGTSMSAPNVSGSLILLQELYSDLYGEYLRSASLKGLVLHTADDAGNAGPDYKFGWGLMNTLKAANIIRNRDFSQIQEHVLENGDELRVRLFTEGDEAIRVTLSWTDLPGIVPPPSLDPTDRILINDLDLRVVREVDGQVFRPWVLDPVQPAQPAGTGDNVLDNIEQVYAETVEKGFYELVVSHKGTLQQDLQPFSLVISGLDSVYFASGIDTLNAHNGSFILTSADEYAPNMHTGWLIAPGNGKIIKLNFNSLDTESGTDLLRIYDGSDTSALLLAELSGHPDLENSTFISTSDSLFVTFVSDGQNQGAGFNAFYCTVPPEGSFSIQGESYPCAGTTETYVVSGQDGTYYTWEPPESWDTFETAGPAASAATLTVGSAGSLLEVTPYNRCGSTDPVGLQVESLSSAPDLTGYKGDTLVCAGAPGTLSVDSLAGATYEWILPGNWQGSSESHSLTFIPTLDPGLIRVSAYNSCAYGDTMDIPVLVKTIPGQSSIFSVSHNLCQNSVNRFFVLPEDRTTYQWSADPGWQIQGSDQGDSVDVLVGENSSYLYVRATNNCGSRVSNAFFLTAPQPDSPLLMDSQSTYENYRKLEVQNAASYQLIQWYLDRALIDSPEATGPSYIAFRPGIYTVGVTNRDGCILLQDPADGINVSGPDHLYAAYGGAEGSLVVQNTTHQTTTVNVYDLSGNLLLIHTAEPGYNEIPTRLKGAFVVSVHGLGNPYISRVFIH